MILTEPTVFNYLRERGIVTSESVVDGDWTVLGDQSRNTTLRVLRRRAPGYFVKQARRWDADALGTLRREAGFYALVRRADSFAMLRTFCPVSILYDPECAVLVLEYFAGAETLAAHVARSGALAPDLGSQLGRCLATVHTGDAAAASEYGGFPGTVPSVLLLHRETSDAWRDLSPGRARLLHILRSTPEFCDRLDTLHTQWRRSALIHGDIRFTNVLLVPGHSTDPRPALKLIDWELTDIGDPAWDVAGVLQAFLCSWIESLPADPSAPPDRLAADAERPLSSLQPALRAFWSAYAEAICFDAAAAAAFLERSTGYCAARMIQTAWESLRRAEEMSGFSLRLLQVSRNILQRPDTAIVDLLGIA